MPGAFRSSVTPIVCVLGLFSITACSHPESAADRHAADMSEAISSIEGEHDRFDEKQGPLELAAGGDKDAGAKSTAPKSAGSAKGAPQPPARVVQLGADAPSGESDDPEDGAARPEIRLVGTGGGSVRTRGRSRGRSDRVDEAELSALRTDSPSSAVDPAAKKAYEDALAEVQSKHFVRGREGLTAFLTRWPDHPYAENALYWRGEAYFGERDYHRAASEFEAVLQRFGSGSKAPDAMLKLGMCHDRLGASQRAREVWDRLKAEFPRSEAARRIPDAGRDSLKKGPKENR